MLHHRLDRYLHHPGIVYGVLRGASRGVKQKYFASHPVYLPSRCKFLSALERLFSAIARWHSDVPPIDLCMEALGR
jgi:hypothetical protein